MADRSSFRVRTGLVRDPRASGALVGVALVFCGGSAVPAPTDGHGGRPAAARSRPAAAGDSRPAPYSLPWQLRPAAAATVLRSDTATAFYNPSFPADNGSSGIAVASTLLGSLRLTLIVEESA